MLAVGLMSGTSMDGVDAALIETDGRAITVHRGPNNGPNVSGGVASLPYSDAEKDLLRRAEAEAAGLTDRTARPGCLGEAEALVTRSHVAAVEALLRQTGLGPTDIGVIGFHGQTLLHRPEVGLTIQIGDGEALARKLGIPVVWDLRAADMAAGGQGAPLVPVFHRALAEASGFGLPLAILNIGGIANVTFLGADDAMAGFDTGPGNALLDGLMLERTGAACDEDGAAARSGRIDRDLLAWILAHPFFAKRPPKSLDRADFSHRMVGRMRTEDAAATLAAFTVAAVARSVAWTPEPPRRWIVGGGGARNPILMEGLRATLGVAVETAEEAGWSTEGLEAQAFAYLAARSLAGLPITFPSTTGVSEPLTGGRLARP